MEWSTADLKLIGILPELLKQYDDLGFLPILRDSEVPKYGINIKIVDVKDVGERYDITLKGPTSILDISKEFAHLYGNDEGIKFREQLMNLAEDIGLGVDSGWRLYLQEQMSEGQKGYIIPRMVEKIFSGEMELRKERALAMVGLRNHVVVEKSHYNSLKDFKSGVSKLLE